METLDPQFKEEFIDLQNESNTMPYSPNVDIVHFE